MRGFTLIELVVTMAIVAILTAIAYPLYLHQVVEGRRSGAESVLMDVAQREQQYFLDQRGYTAISPAGNLVITVPDDVSEFYTISVSVQSGPPPSFTATATPIAGTPQAGDYILSIDQTGAKETIDPATAAQVTPGVW